MQKEHITQASDALLNRQNGLAQAVYRKNACRSRGPEGYIARRDRECEFTVLYAVAVLTRHWLQSGSNLATLSTNHEGNRPCLSANARAYSTTGTVVKMADARWKCT
jgi:hypothetical protein